VTSNNLTTRQRKRGLEEDKIMRGDEEQVERNEQNENRKQLVCVCVCVQQRETEKETGSLLPLNTERVNKTAEKQQENRGTNVLCAMMRKKKNEAIWGGKRENWTEPTQRKE